MSGYFSDVLANWMNIITFGLVDYVTDKFVTPPLSQMGLAGAYGAGGLNFQAKMSAAASNPLQGIRGALMR